MDFVTRRRFLKQSAVLTAGLAAAACAQPTPQPAAPTAQPAPTTAAPAPAATVAPTAVPAATKAVATTAAPTAVPAPTKAAAPTAAPPPAAAAAVGKESPMLAELVKAGKLPPLDQRLPKDPKVSNEMPPSELKMEIGRYGGTLRTVTSLADRDADVTVSSREPLVNTPGIHAVEFTPNIVKAFSVSPDSSEYTFVLREGMKWSDGEPLTMTDVRFAIEDVLQNKELTANLPPWLRVGNTAAGEPMTFEVVDDWTFKLKFPKPYAGFLVVLSISGWRSYPDLIKPAHYLKPFHKTYADAAKLDAAVKEAKFETWVQLFTSKDVLDTQLAYRKAIGFPMLRPWVTKEINSQTFSWERNPYYFKVDAEGNQLPYIDNVQSSVVQNIETVVMKQISGEIDFARESASLFKMPLYKENEAKSGLKVRMARMHVTPADAYLNQTFKDPVWREVVRNLKFRQALNFAIDREELIDAIYFGYAEKATIVPNEYSVAKANALLDEIGMNKRDAENHRLGPDGKTFVIAFDIAGWAPDIQPATELFVQFWEAVGIKTTMKLIDQTLWSQRNSANELAATCFWTSTPLWFYGESGAGLWAPLWNRWYTTAGKDGEEPPAVVLDYLKKLSSIFTVPPAEAVKITDEARKMMYDNVFFFVPIEKVMQPLVTNAKLANISESPEAFAIGSNFGGEQFFYRS